jgi:prolyl-tRNA editing enzyme YbaK/EbsC (Cys-tRNA(Pro) deacylase)
MKQFGTLTFVPATDDLSLMADPVQKMAKETALPDVYVCAIDSSLADTGAFCEHYKIGMDVSANCVILEAKRADKVWYAACMVLATTRADINGIVRKYLDARKISFAPMDTATRLTAMEFGGITPIGLPNDWPILVDGAVASTDWIIIGSGIRGSKLLIPGSLPGKLPNAMVMSVAKNTGE